MSVSASFPASCKAATMRAIASSTASSDSSCLCRHGSSVVPGDLRVQAHVLWLVRDVVLVQTWRPPRLQPVQAANVAWRRSAYFIGPPMCGAFGEK